MSDKDYAEQWQELVYLVFCSEISAAPARLAADPAVPLTQPPGPAGRRFYHGSR